MQPADECKRYVYRQINVCVQRHDLQWNVCITKHVALHNHRVDGVVHSLYADKRKTKELEVLKTGDLLRRSGTNHKKILQYIHENSDA